PDAYATCSTGPSSGGCTSVEPDANACGSASCDETQLNTGASETSCKNGETLYVRTPDGNIKIDGKLICNGGTWTGTKNGGVFTATSVSATCNAPCNGVTPTDEVCPTSGTCNS
ncbi:hypothetical protein PENTCL1PPCAC_20426, partial [Pristionchus entomophagus]